MAKRAKLELAVDNTVEQAVKVEEQSGRYRLAFQDPIRTSAAELALVLNELGIMVTEEQYNTFSRFTKERFVKLT